MRKDLVVSGAFKDYFSEGSNEYAAHRPTYPDALFAYLAELAPARTRAWDCATGNGQVALALAKRFERVVASDASEAQLREAPSHPRVDYRVATAEDSGLPDRSFDLLTVGQAFHWFEANRFFSEAQRVLRSDGILALWCYEICHVDAACDAVIDHLYRDIVGDYWTPERELIEQGYSTFDLPGKTIEAPDFEMALLWSADDMLGYLGTWSAGRRYKAAHDVDPVTLIEDPLREVWGSERRQVVWPLRTRICQPNAANNTLD